MVPYKLAWRSHVDLGYVFLLGRWVLEHTCDALPAWYNGLVSSDIATGATNTPPRHPSLVCLYVFRLKRNPGTIGTSLSINVSVNSKINMYRVTFRL